MKQDVFEAYKQRLNGLCDYDPKKGRAINEFTLLGNSLEEAGDDDEQNPADPTGAAAPGADPMGGAAAADPMGGGAMGADPMGGVAGADPMGGAAPGADPTGGAAPGADPAAAGGDEGGQAQPPEGFNPQDAPMDPMGGAADPAMGGEGGEQPGDEVLDVTELTDKQDDIEGEVEKIGGKFDKVMKAIGAFEELLRSNDEKIDNLKAEFERRNPTQVEKLGLQKEKSYPFNVTPEEFWNEKEATSNYSTEPDNNGKGQGQYVITADDVNGDTNWKAIADSLSDDFLYNQTLDKLLKF